MDNYQEIIYDMKTIRHLADRHIILTDEVLRDAGKQGANAGLALRRLLGERVIHTPECD